MKKIIPMFLSFFIFPDINFNFQSPSGMGIDKNGMIYVADSGSSKIKRYSRQGRLNLEFGEMGEGDGCFDGPKDVAINSKGDIYIADTWNNRVCIFSNNGTFKMNIGGLGEGLGRFKFPNSIAIDGDDYLYIVDSGNGVIQKFDPSGRFIMEFGKKEGLKWPSGIAIGDCGLDGIADCGFKEDIYISDSGNNRIMRFNKDGGFIESIRGIENPLGMAFGSDKNLYIADGTSGIMKYAGYKFVPFIKNLSNPLDIVFLGPFIFVSESGRNKILKFSLDGLLEEEWTSTGFSLERLNLPYDMAVTNNGIYIADTGNNRILSLDFSFKPKRVWDISSPIAIFADSQENIYVASSRENTVIKFDKAGNELLSLKNLVLLRDVVVDDKGAIFVLTSCEVLKFSSDGSPLGTICSSLKEPSGIAFDNLKFILVSDENMIKKFSQSGMLIKTMENLSSPSGIVVDKNDNIYVAERGKNKILKLDFQKEVREVVSSPKLSYPYGLTLDNDGNLYIADCGNHRIVILGGYGDRFKEVRLKPKSYLCDLVVEKIEVDKPSLGIWTRISVTIRNQGNTKGDFISVGFFSSTGKIGFGKIIKTLAPEQIIRINTIWLPEEGGTQTLKVVLDQEDKIKEDDKENNIKGKEIFVW